MPLVVEVADDSLSRDKGIKLPLYARAGIAQSWIVDVQARVIETYCDPQGETYATSRIVGETETLEVELAGKRIGQLAVGSLLP